MVSIDLNSPCLASQNFGLKVHVCGAVAFTQLGSGRFNGAEVLAGNEFKFTDIYTLDFH